MNYRSPQSQQMSSGLLRYRSAPSSFLEEVCEYLLPVRPSSPETETMLSRIFSEDMDKAFGVAERSSSQFEEVSKAEFVASKSHTGYQQQQISSRSSAEGSNRALGLRGIDAEQIKTQTSSLIRQSSTPAGLFSLLNVENGFGMMREISGLGNANCPSANGAKRLPRQLSFSSRQNSIMSQISEMESEGMDSGSPEDSSGANRSFVPGFPVGSSEAENNFSGLKRDRDGSSFGSQTGEARNRGPVLSPQFSLPKTSSEMEAIEKFLQLEDAVPCKIRAKRGFATHPRSIAERVRRTKISERMRKLQELVPNMDKQTNTADMLDLAVDYIKELRKQAKTLLDARERCTCYASEQK